MNEHTEDVDAFRARCSAWLRANLPTAADERAETDQSRAGRMARARQRQAALFDAGLAGLAFPRRYGGQGLGRAHQEVMNTESLPYAMPAVLGVPSIGVLGATLLDAGSEEQKREHLPRLLRGDEVWVQLLSEPTGGSDLAGARLRAELDGDEWVLNGAKMWTSNALLADWGMCLARTDWTVPKHSGLTMFLVPLDAPGLSIRPIALATGHSDFCQEYFDDVRLPASAVIGDVNDGWRVATQLLVHERDTVGGNSKYARPNDGGYGDDSALVDILPGTDPAPGVEAYIVDLAHRCLVERITALIDEGALPPTAGALLKLSSSLRGNAIDDMALEAAGIAAVFARRDAPTARRFGERYLVRQAMSLAGGSNEMQRNIISERVLNMPREPRVDVGIPFSDVGTFEREQDPTRRGAPRA